eukprot:TRINITY_DN20024_c0_g1_i1.p1 TRINITY_DN20024_c0_g1~~TRINITY_DN20024_c0_g1_i1.p1  ORF type:complete len:386 (-),score=33.14 TRINITY_DN20024_c0_g1_i1:134-1291(-)
MALAELAKDLERSSISYLDALSLVRLARCSSDLHYSCNSDAFWQDLVLHNWGWLVRLPPPGQSWRWLYIRLAKRTHSQFIVLGGAPPGTPPRSGYARAYDLSAQTWSDMATCAEERNGAAVVRDIHGGVVVAGGLCHGQQLRSLKTVERFSPEEGAWKQMPDLNLARCCCSSAVDKRGNIVVVGGGESMYYSSPAWASTEFYDASEAKDFYSGLWKNGPAMKQARCAVGVACSYETDVLFAAGGYGGHGLYLDTAERLDLSATSEGRWQPLPKLSCKRAGANAAVGPDHRLYVLGGGPDGRSEYDTMEALDPRESRWNTSLARLRFGRHYNAAAFGPDGCLYVAGAFRHCGQLQVVERYEPRVDRWETLTGLGVPVQFSAGTFIF